MVGEMSVRGNALVGKCPVGEVSVEEVSGQGIVRSGKCPSGKCQSGIFPRGSVGSGNWPTIDTNLAPIPWTYNKEAQQICHIHKTHLVWYWSIAILVTRISIYSPFFFFFWKWIYSQYFWKRIRQILNHLVSDVR